MNTELKFIIPALLSFLGVLVGWGLKESSDLFRGAAEAKRIRMRGVYQLIRLYQEMVRVERLLEQVKEATGDWKLFESFRSRYAEKYGDKSEDFITDLKVTILKMAETDPWSATELRHVVETYLSLKETKLSVLQNIGLDSYIRGLSTIEAVYLKGILALRKLIIAESKRCGVITHYRTCRSLKKFERLQMEKMPGGLEADLKSLFSNLEKKQNEK